jgi:hypothetical protein
MLVAKLGDTSHHGRAESVETFFADEGGGIDWRAEPNV